MLRAVHSRIKQKNNLVVRCGLLCGNSDTPMAEHAICEKYAGRDCSTPDTIGLVRVYRTDPTANFSTDSGYRCDETDITLPLEKMFSMSVKKECVNGIFVLDIRNAGYEFDDVSS